MNRITAWLFAPLLLCLTPACDDTSDTKDGVCPATCDDGKDCTDDRCDTETGQCVHVPRDVAEACRQDSHCDDGDPCTTDTCAFDVAGGCPELQRCHHEQLPGCRSCPQFPSQCDDADPCTTDSCGADLICRYTSYDFCDSRCNTQLGFSYPSSTFVGDARVRGYPWPKDGAACTDGCSCTKELALTDGEGGQIRVAGLDSPSTCEVTSCSDYTCAPLAAHRTYLVYGQASNPPPAQALPARSPDGGSGAPLPADVALPPDFATQLAVEGYCLFLDQDGIDGTYDGTLVLDGEAQAVSFRLVFDQVRATVSGSERVTASGVYAYSQDGVALRVELQLDNRTIIGRLFPGHDRLQGPVYDPSQPADQAGASDPSDGAQQIPEPPRDDFGKEIGFLTLILR